MVNETRAGVQLTASDIDTLVDALETWVNKGETSMFLGAIVGSLIAKEDEESKARAKSEQASAMEQHRNESAARKKQAIVLQAKLLQAREMLS